MNILEEIAERTRERIREEKRRLPLGELRRQAEERGGQGSHAFRGALKSPGLSFICEVKKASPSKGVIARDFPYLDIAREYEAAGASAVSCLTEPFYFQGKDEFAREIAETVKIPVLRKDFTVDEYMVYQAKAMGAAAILLICAILDDGQLAAYSQLAGELGMDALVETHTAGEVERAIRAGAPVIGINNRDLKTFQVDLEAGLKLRDMIPADRVFVSESGIHSEDDIKKLLQCRADGALIGERLMREPDKKGLLERWRNLDRDYKSSRSG